MEKDGAVYDVTRHTVGLCRGHNDHSSHQQLKNQVHDSIRGPSDIEQVGMPTDPRTLLIASSDGATDIELDIER